MRSAIISRAHWIVPQYKASIPRNPTRSCSDRHRLTNRSVAWYSKSCPPKLATCIGFACTRASSIQTRASTIRTATRKRTWLQLWQIHATKKNAKARWKVCKRRYCMRDWTARLDHRGHLCDTRDVIQLPSIQFAQTVISMAIEPENTAERKKLSEVLEMLKRQDPTFIRQR